MSNYLRNRPFMIFNYRYTLVDGQKSNTPGFGANANWDPVENMTIVDRVSNRQMNDAELILDLFENKVVKCRDSAIDHGKIFDVMVARYKSDIRAALDTWLRKDPVNIERVNAFIARFAKKAEEPVAPKDDNDPSE